MASLNYVANISHLSTSLDSILEKVTNDIVNKAYDMLMDALDKTIYQPAPPEASYERTYEFRNKAWVTEVKSFLKEYIGRVYFDGKRMSPPSYSSNAGYSHGNLEDGVDRRMDMAWILNDYYASAMNADWINAKGYHGAYYPGDYWDIFINNFEKSLDDLCVKSFKKYGLNVEKVR